MKSKTLLTLMGSFVIAMSVLAYVLESNSEPPPVVKNGAIALEKERLKVFLPDETVEKLVAGEL